MPIKITQHALQKVLAKPALPTGKYEGHFGTTMLQASPIKQHTEIVKKNNKDKTTEVLKNEQTNLHTGIITQKKTGLSLSYKASQTINTGNYESVTVAVMLTAPCEPEELEPTYDWVTSWVSEKITSAVKEAKGE